jgi:chromosome segregation ATPase
MKTRPKNQLTAAGRAAHEAAKKRGDKRTEEVRARVRETMAAIATEMAANGGIYPHRNGALSAAEVARRSEVHPTSFHTPKLKDLGEEVRQWLADLATKQVVGSVKARKSLVDRLSDWQDRYKGLEQSHRDTELQLQEVERQLEEAEMTIAELRSENKRLQASATANASSKVVPLRRKKD